MHPAIYATFMGLLIAVYILRQRKQIPSLPLPPGPKPLPLIGNVHQAPKSHAWRTYREWSKEYGPIVHVNMMGQSVIIVSTSEVAHELLAKRGAIFSDRPRLFVCLPRAFLYDEKLMEFVVGDGASVERTQHPPDELHRAIPATSETPSFRLECHSGGSLFSFSGFGVAAIDA